MYNFEKGYFLISTTQNTENYDVTFVDLVYIRMPVIVHCGPMCGKIIRIMDSFEVESSVYGHLYCINMTMIMHKQKNCVC